MNRFLSRFDETGYTLLRFVAGFLFCFHGMQKILGMHGGTVQPMFTMMWTAGIIELTAGTLVALGLLTTPLALLASGQMAVAYFTAHQPAGPWPIQNRGELAALYAFVFLYVAMKGSGRFSVDALIGRAR